MNFFLAEDLIVQRLAENVKDIKGVFHAFDTGTIEGQFQVAPSIYVLFGGASAGGQAGKGINQIIEQPWIVVGVVRVVRDERTHQGVRENGGVLVTQIVESLGGWAPTVDHDPLVLASMPLPRKSDGFGYFPVFFQTEIVLRGKLSPMK